LATAAAITLAAPSAASAATCPGGDTVPAAGNMDQVASATVCEVNAQRSAHGLAPLQGDATLAKAARGHARDMVQEGVFAHQIPGGASLNKRVRSAGYGASGQWGVGEVLAWGTGSRATPAQTVQAWMNSTGHREIILDGRYTEAGPAIVTGTPKKRGVSGGATYAIDVGFKR
jgi:uncharacterized protein YkwD